VRQKFSARGISLVLDLRRELGMVFRNCPDEDISQAIGILAKLFWVPLFVSDAGGALGARRAEDRSGTEQFLESPSLAAALFAWSLELPERPATPIAAQGWMVLALAVARHPWLWGLQNVQAVERHLFELLRATSVDFSDRDISARWSTFTRLGEALFGLEACLDRRSLPHARYSRIEILAAFGIGANARVSPCGQCHKLVSR
jgi:hypothetical protein